MFLSKQEILGAHDRTTEEVPVPEWAPEGNAPGTCFVRVRSLSGKQRDAFEVSMMSAVKSANGSNLVNMRARLCAYCMVDEAGSRLFADNEVALLGERSAKALNRVFIAAQRLSGFTDTDVEELEKNSAPGPSDSSPSISA